MSRSALVSLATSSQGSPLGQKTCPFAASDRGTPDIAVVIRDARFASPAVRVMAEAVTVVRWGGVTRGRGVKTGRRRREPTPGTSNTTTAMVAEGMVS